MPKFRVTYGCSTGWHDQDTITQVLEFDNEYEAWKYANECAMDMAWHEVESGSRDLYGDADDSWTDEDYTQAGLDAANDIAIMNVEYVDES